MKFFRLSTLALAVTLSFGAVMPAEANVINLLLQKKRHQQYQQHQQHHQPHNRHHERVRAYHNQRSNYRGSRPHQRLNNRARYSSPRRRVFDRRGSYGNWSVRY